MKALTVQQIQTLEELLERKGISLDHLIHITDQNEKGYCFKHCFIFCKYLVAYNFYCEMYDKELETDLQNNRKLRCDECLERVKT
jgi:hypothetical protein